VPLDVAVDYRQSLLDLLKLCCFGIVILFEFMYFSRDLVPLLG
jgi:hypothetical protein